MIDKEVRDAEAVAGNESRSESGETVVEGRPQGSDGSGSPDGEANCSEHELQPAVGEEDRDLLPEARGGQEGDGLASGGEGLSESGPSSVGSLGRGSGEDVGEEVVPEADGRTSEVRFDAGFQSILDSRTPVAFAEFAARASGKVDRSSLTVEGVSLAERGVAKGHYMWLDQEFVDQLAAQMPPAGRLKCRLGHPSMFGEDRRAVAYFSDLYRDGDKCRAKMNILKAARNIPGLGDVAGWVMDMAEEASDMFGLSIVFSRDLAAEDAFIAENLVKQKDGYSMFKSPDPKNKQNYPHVRLAKLEACDIVDSPAANTNGLFGDETSNEVFAFITGSKEAIPTVVQPERIDELMAARSAYAAFSAEKEEERMEEEATLVEDEGFTEEDHEEDVDMDFEPVDFDTAAAAAAQLPRSVLLDQIGGEGIDIERETIAAAYSSVGAKAPWVRNKDSWALYEQICADADRRGVILSEDYLAMALEVCGFTEESQSIVDSMLADIDDEFIDEPVEQPTVQASAKDELELSEDQIRAIVRNVVAAKAQQMTGKLD